MSGKSKAAAIRKGILNSTITKLFLATSVLASPVAAVYAATGNIQFSATVPDNNNNNGGGGDPGTGDPGDPTLNGCQILLVNNSTMAVSTDFLQLSSKEAGAVPAEVDIVKTGTANLAVSIDTPASFTTNPLGGDTGVAISTSYQSSGATVTGEIPGNTATAVNEGTSRIVVNMLASRPDPFPAGTYETTATVRCE